jgi:antitoxin component of RelBE/YafQ-DinJ toxin-antitoxin module
MVTTLNITLDDEVAEHAREVKDELGLTWAEYVEEAAGALAE